MGSIHLISVPYAAICMAYVYAFSMFRILRQAIPAGSPHMMFLNFLFFSESQVIIYQNHMDPVFMSGISGNEELAADGIGGFAVHAGTCLCAGR